MDNLLYLCLEAHNPERNHHRRYEVRLGRDLFGRWVVTIGYGRTGLGGQQRTYSDSNPEHVRAVIFDCLERRQSAPRRIGCRYRLHELSAGPGIDLGFWLPPTLLSDDLPTFRTGHGARSVPGRTAVYS